MSDEVFRQFQASVARIYNRAGVVVGGGFLVADGYLLTCAHVVAAASGILQSQKEMPTGSLELDFPLDAVQQTRAAERVRATVVVWFPVGYSSMMEDVAVLRLLDSAPGTVLPVSVKAVSDFQDNHPLRIYGFPTGAPEGRWTVPVSRGWNGRGWIQMVNPGVGDYPVEPGYSGSPVWDGSVPGIVGMTVARDIREAVNGSFMIPKKGLLPALRGIEQHSLLELLEPVERDLQPVIKQAYFLCRPEGWKSPNPATLQGILDELIAMPDDQMGYSPVHRFIALIGVQQLQAAMRERLFSWLSGHCSEAQSLIEWAEQRICELDQQCATARSYLLIQLQKSTQQSSTAQTYYQTNAWLILDDRNYDPRTGVGSKSLSAPPEPLPLSAIPERVGQWLDEISEEAISPERLTVEIFVPSDLLNHPIDQWCPPDESEFSICLGQEYGLVIRSTDRLANNYRYKGQWKARWEKLESTKTELTCHDLMFANQAASELVNALMPSHHLGVRSPASLETGPRGKIALIHRLGLPVAVWLRENPFTGGNEPENEQQGNSDSQTGCQLRCILEAQPQCSENRCLLFTLPERVQTQRNSVDNPIAPHLALLWEDFMRVPPTTTNPLSGERL